MAGPSDEEEEEPPKKRECLTEPVKKPPLTSKERMAMYRANMSADKATAVREKNKESHAVIRYVNIFVTIINFINIILRANMSDNETTAEKDKNRESHAVLRFINAFVTVLI